MNEHCNDHCQCEAVPTAAPTLNCGDGQLDDGEECDYYFGSDGGCFEAFGVSGLKCNNNCKCRGCGNGKIQGMEQCDFKLDTKEPFGCSEYEYCTDNCKCEAVPTAAPTLNCGDGQLDQGEECDYNFGGNGGCFEAFGVSGLSCNDQCKCTGCGNGMIEGGEQCDYKLGNKGCSEYKYCANDCKCEAVPTAALTVNCGDGQLDDGKECDFNFEVAEGDGSRSQNPKFSGITGLKCNQRCECKGCGNVSTLNLCLARRGTHVS